MYYKKLLTTTKISDEKIIEIFVPYLINEIEFEERKDNDITLFFIIDTQEMSRECLIFIIKQMIEKKTISKNDVEYITNNYEKYNLSINELY